MGLRDRYPDLPDGLVAGCTEGYLSSMGPDYLERPGFTHIGLMVSGIPNDGAMRNEEFERLLGGFGVSDRSRLSGTLAWGHFAATSWGSLGTQTLYAVSRKRDSELYMCELNMDELYPVLR